jgi:hypothetical protein
MCGGMTFTAGTRVLLAGGTTSPISSLQKDDKVEAGPDTRSGNDQPETITAVLGHRTPTCKASPPTRTTASRSSTPPAAICSGTLTEPVDPGKTTQKGRTPQDPDPDRPNGKPLDPDVNLTPAQQRVIDNNRGTIRKAIGKYMSWYKNECK